LRGSGVAARHVGAVLFCALTRSYSVPGVPGRHGTFLVSPRKVPQRRRPEGHALRCATDSLRFSKPAAAAELAACSRSNSPRRLPRSFLRCSARPTGLYPWLCLHLSLAGLGRVGSLLPTDPRGQNCPPYKNDNIYLPCKPLWYCLTALPADQYQSGLQPNEKTANRCPLPFAPPRTGSREERRASQAEAGKSARTV
jgi:hypothetical protein